jgi:Flp pilus assembly protein TadG
MRPAPPHALLRAFARARGGVAAVEFALTLPMMILLYFGGYEASDAVATYRKLADTTATIANVAAQYTTMSQTDVASVFAASSQVMAPYSTATLSIVMSEIQTDAKSNATVAWSRATSGATPLAQGAVVTLPTGMASPSTFYIQVVTTYVFVLPTGIAFTQNLSFSNQIYMVPRNSASISLT